MAATVGVYWLVPQRWRAGFLVLFTLTFLFAVHWVSALFLIVFTVGTYALTKGERVSKLSIAAAIAAVVAVVAYYKVEVAHLPFSVIRDVAMPVGMSYYAFRVIHYLIDKYRGVLPEHDFYDYVCYLFFVPTLLVGPIHRFAPFYNNRRAVEWRADDLSEGIERIVIGYFKIVVLGHFLFSKWMVQAIGQIDPSYQATHFYLEAVRGSFNLYFQFAGYSDIAIGFALLLGYRVMENFNSPFTKTNIAEFWRSWHISLTSWSRDYIYMSTVGLTRNPYFGTLVSLTAIGIWHELSLRYVAWGLYHGLGIIAANQFQKFVRGWKKAHGIKNVRKDRNIGAMALSIFATWNYFFFGYIIINQHSFVDTFRVYRIILFGWL